MANQWFRLWHDMPNDPKWRTISRVSKQPITAVISVYLHVLVCASNATERGRTQGLDCEDVASALDLENEQVEAIISAMQGRVLDGDKVSGWEKRQPAREDGSAGRAKEWREAQKAKKNAAAAEEGSSERNRTQPNAPDKDTDTEEPTEADASVVGGDAANESAIRKTDRLPDCPQREILALYAEILPDLPQPIAWEGARATNLRARWRWVLAERLRKGKSCNREDGIDFFRRMFGYVAGNDFLSGRTSSWKGCDLGWLVKAENFAKVLAGNFDRKEAA